MGSGVAQSSIKAFAFGSEAMCSATDLLCPRILARRATIPARGSPVDRRLSQPLSFSWTGQMSSALVVVGSGGVIKVGEAVRRLNFPKLIGLSLVLTLLTQSPDQADQGSFGVASRIRSRAGWLIQKGKEGLEPGSMDV